jgi:phosphoenolpyruvate carboxykinase (GTP)
VFESFDWKHGTYVGAMVASETTAAATGAVGVVRRDPMAMLPFCGYNMADYFGHWLKVGAQSDKAPKIFHVNWFRQDKDGKFLWPGFGENMRVLRWVLERCEGKAKAVDTPIGRVPAADGLDMAGLSISRAVMEELLDVDAEAWQAELAGQKEFLEQFGEAMPEEMWKQYRALEERLTVGAR